MGITRTALTKYLLLVFITTINISCTEIVNQIELTCEESAVLHTFFHVFLKESEAGYVIFNQKPVCIHGYQEKNMFNISSPFHKESVAIKEGSRIWKYLDKHTDKSDIYIHICNNEDPHIRGYKHVLIINIPLFHSVVNKNLFLFQQVLGPSLTSQKLLDAIIFEDKPFHELLKYDNILIGIILGFGTQNSLICSRIESIQENFEKHIPPFTKNELITMEYSHEHVPFKPSFGYKKNQDELYDLENQMNVSTKKLLKEKPTFVYGWSKNLESEETKNSLLEITQDKIQELLASPTFLEQILKRITGKKYHAVKNDQFEFQLDSKLKNHILAKGIFEAINIYDRDCLIFFINALNGSKNKITKLDQKSFSPNFRKELLHARKNLVESDRFFLQMSKEQAICVVPQRLYYKIIREGKNDVKLFGHCATLSYSIFSPEGICLSSESDVFINLKNTIIGFKLCVKGMRVGETRELWIHPSLAYGYDTSIEKCIYLRVIVTCEEFNESQGIVLNKECADPIDLEFLRDPNIEKNTTELYTAALIQKGGNLKEFLIKDKSLNLLEITKDLKIFNEKQTTDFITSKTEQKLINQVFWNIYFR